TQYVRNQENRYFDGSSDSVHCSWKLNFFSKLSEYEATSQFNHSKRDVDLVRINSSTILEMLLDAAASQIFFTIFFELHTYVKYSLAIERAVAINAVLRASKVCQKVFQNLATNDTVIKKDRSSVTVADFSAQAVVNRILYESFPNDPIVGEEESGSLQGDSGKELRNKVLSLVNTVLDIPLNDNE
ncbi:10992_t:CDS:2, partial [Gigaspora rosea]